MTEQGAIPFTLPTFLAYKIADLSLRIRERKITLASLAIHSHEMDRRVVFTRNRQKYEIQ